MTALAPTLQAFFSERLIRQRQVSSHTIAAYRDTLRMLLDFAAKNRIPIATGWGAWVQNGALLSYGPNIDEIVRQSASHVDKIFRGAKPADLPIEQPTRFELVLNLRTARTLNLTVPQSLIVRADRVIE